MGSPPPEGSKKEVLKLRSVRSMVIAPARTGSDSNNKKAVKKTDQAKSGISSQLRAGERILAIVVRKLMEPRIELIPARCKEKIPKSTDIPGCPRVERGG